MRSQLEILLGVPLPGFYIHQISQTLKYRNDEKLKEYGITFQQAKVLAHIARHQPDPLFCQKHLEKELDLRGSSVTSLLHGLERGGFIRRISEEQDGRKKKILLTEKGRKMHQLFNDVILDGEKELVHDLTPQEQEQLYRLLKRIAKTKGETV